MEELGNQFAQTFKNDFKKTKDSFLKDGPATKLLALSVRSVDGNKLLIIQRREKPYGSILSTCRWQKAVSQCLTFICSCRVQNQLIWPINYLVSCMTTMTDSKQRYIWSTQDTMDFTNIIFGHCHCGLTSSPRKNSNQQKRWQSSILVWYPTFCVTKIKIDNVSQVIINKSTDGSQTLLLPQCR